MTFEQATLGDRTNRQLQSGDPRGLETVLDEISPRVQRFLSVVTLTDASKMFWMPRIFRSLLFIVASMSSLAVSEKASAQQNHALDHDLVETLAAAIDTWHQQVEFSCHWIMSETTAASREDAAAGRFQQPLEKEAEGRYAKAGDLIYSSIDYGTPPKKVGDNSYLQTSYAEVRNTEVTLHYQLQNEHPTGMITAVSDSEGVRRSPVGGPRTLSVMNPLLVLSKGSRPNTIRYYQERHSAGEDVQFQVTQGENKHLQVQIVHATSQFTNTVRLRFWMEPSIPVIDHVDIRSEVSGRTVRGGQGFDDFVQVDGGMVAKKTWLYSPRTSESGKLSGYRVVAWQADEFQQTPPQTEDFLLHVPEGVELSCLKTTARPELVAGVRTYDISKLSLDDMLPECRGEASGDRLAEYWWIRWLCVLVGAAAAIYLAVTLWRKKGRTPAIR